VSYWTSRAHELRAAQARALAEALLEADARDDRERRPSRATAAGDWRKLRGLPAVGRGVSGAIPGTRPGDGL
jgi:hypothetical protein